MPFIAAPVVLPDAILPILIKYSKSRSLPIRQVQRSRIVLLAAEGLNNMQISLQVGLGQDSVSKWRNRINKALPLLSEIAVKDPSNLEKEINAFLLDLPRPGQPQIYTDEQIIKILEIACHNPADHGYETSHWSLSQLVNVTVKEGIADSISAKTISRFLKYEENPPSTRPLLAAFLRKSRKSGYICRGSE